MVESAKIYQLDPDDDARFDALIDDVTHYVADATANCRLPAVAAIGALDFVRYRLMRALDDGN